MARERDLRTLLASGAAGTGNLDPAPDASSTPLALRLRSLTSASGDPAAQLARALRLGLRTRKGAGPEGSERVISPAQRARVEALIAGAAPPLAQTLAQDLACITGPAAGLGRALYLKAAAARCQALLGSDAAARTAALATLQAFAARVDGMPRAALLDATTVLDLDGRRSASSFDPLGWDEKRGVVHARGGADRRADNDGLFQRFLGSCGTTTLQMALCEEDPVRALVVHDAGRTAADAGDVVGRFQAEVLREFGSATLGRRANYQLARVRNGLARLRRRGQITDDEARALRAHLEVRGPDTPGVGRAVQALRAWLDGFPDDACLAEIRQDPLKGSDGLELEAFGAMIERYLGPVTGCRYDTVSLPRGLDCADGRRALDRAEEILRSGRDVPFGIDEPGHYLFMSAARIEHGERQFLVSDPWGGTTNWIAERDLVSGRFIETPLDLAAPGEGGVVDCLALAVTAP